MGSREIDMTPRRGVRRRVRLSGRQAAAGIGILFVEIGAIRLVRALEPTIQQAVGASPPAIGAFKYLIVRGAMFLSAMRVAV